MKRSLSIYLWGCLLAMLLALVGFLLVRFGIVNRKNSKRIAAMASVLVAGGGVWLADDLRLVLMQTALDAVALFVALGFGCLALFWVGVVTGFRQFGHLFDQDFGESSILSMQYLDSSMDFSHDEPIWKPHAVEGFSAESSRAAGSVPVSELINGQKAHQSQ